MRDAPGLINMRRMNAFATKKGRKKKEEKKGRTKKNMQRMNALATKKERKKKEEKKGRTKKKHATHECIRHTAPCTFVLV